MAKQHTLTTLADELSSFKTGVNRRFRNVDQDLKTIKEVTNDMHDFIVDNRGFERGRAYKKDGSLNLDPRVFDVIKWALLIAALALGGAKWL